MQLVRLQGDSLLSWTSRPSSVRQSVNDGDDDDRKMSNDDMQWPRGKRQSEDRRAITPHAKKQGRQHRRPLQYRTQFTTRATLCAYNSNIVAPLVQVGPI